MNENGYTENDYEQALIELFQSLEDVYKPMKDHNLMQAIARVNRVFPEKAGGLIV